MKRLTLLTFALAFSGSVLAENYENLVKSAETSGEGVAPISSIWQKENAAALAAATTPEEIAACVACPCRAKKLLAEVKTAYETDPLAAYRIAEVTHYVMEGADAAWYEFWRTSRGSEREIWTAALLERARTSGDDYVTIFCLDQLRWCAYPDQADAVRQLATSRAQGVADFAEQVASELATRND